MYNQNEHKLQLPKIPVTSILIYYIWKQDPKAVNSCGALSMMLHHNLQDAEAGEQCYQVSNELRR